MASTSDIRKGLCIKYNHDIYKIIEFLHVKPGKGPAFVRTKLKSVTNGKVLDNTFPSVHKIDEVKVMTSQYQFLYNDSDYYYFMNNDDYNQITIEKSKIDCARKFFHELGRQINQDNVKYDVVTDYGKLMEIVSRP